MALYSLHPDEEDLYAEYLGAHSMPANDLALPEAAAAPMALEQQPPAPEMASGEDMYAQYLAAREPAAAPVQSSYEAPPEWQRGSQWQTWLAMALDMALNKGTGAAQYVASLASSGEDPYENYMRKEQAKDRASVRDARAMQQAAPANTLPRERFEAEQARLKEENSAGSALSRSTQDAAIRLGLFPEEQARQMSHAQIMSFRPQAGAQLQQERGHEKILERMDRSHELGLGTIDYRDRVSAEGREQRDLQRDLDKEARDAQRKKDEEARAASLNNPKTQQEHSEKYGTELRMRGLDRVRPLIDQINQKLAQYEGKDVPGFGATANVPDAMLSAEGRELRRLVKELKDSKLRIATGAAAPPSEDATFSQILGMGFLASDSDLRSGLRQASSIVDQQMGYVAEMYPAARQVRGGARQQPAAAPRQPRVWSLDELQEVQP